MKPKHPWNVIDFFFNNSSFIRILHGHLCEMAEASNQVPKSRDEPGIMLLYLQGKGRQRSWNNSTSSQIKWLVNQHSTACSLITLKKCMLAARLCLPELRQSQPAAPSTQNFPWVRWHCRKLSSSAWPPKKALSKGCHVQHHWQCEQDHALRFHQSQQALEATHPQGSGSYRRLLETK